MNKLFSLIKATMSEGMNIFVYRAKGEKSRHIMPLVLALIMFFTLFGSAESMMIEMQESGKQYMVLAIFVLMTSVLTVMEGIYKAGSLLFSCRDNDLLLSMPIQRSTITFLRLFKFYVFELIYNSIFLGPAILAYAINIEISVSFILVAIIMLLLLPIIPIAIATVLGVFNTAVAARFKHSSVTQVILSLLSLGLVLVLLFLFNASSESVSTTVEAIGNKTIQFYYPATAFVNLATSFDIGELAMFIGINLAVFVLLVAVIGKFYFQIVTRVNVVKRDNKSRKPLKLRKRSQTGAMVKKELVKYFNTPVLVTNTALGLVLFVIAVVAICLKFDDVVGALSNTDFPLTADQIRGFAPSIAFAMVAFTSLMTFITTTMISLEGKAFNVLKTMPISGLKVIYTKVLASLLLIIPVTLLGTIVLAIRFQFPILDLLLLLIAVVVTPFVTELIGILIDLKYARFDSESEAEIVKQSPGVMASSFLALFMVIVTISLLFVAVLFCGQTVGMTIMNAVFVIISLFLMMVIGTRGEEKYSKLSA